MKKPWTDEMKILHGNKKEWVNGMWYIRCDQCAKYSRAESVPWTPPRQSFCPHCGGSIDMN